MASTETQLSELRGDVKRHSEDIRILKIDMYGGDGIEGCKMAVALFKQRDKMLMLLLSGIFTVITIVGHMVAGWVHG